FFPWMAGVIDMIPPWMILALQPAAKGLLDAKQSLYDQGVAAIERASKRPAEDFKNPKTMIDALVDPSIPPEERTPIRVRDEGLSMLLAGSETSARILTVGSFYLAHNKEVLRK